MGRLSSLRAHPCLKQDQLPAPDMQSAPMLIHTLGEDCFPYTTFEFPLPSHFCTAKHRTPLRKFWLHLFSNPLITR